MRSLPSDVTVDAVCGALLGILVLHPVSMLIVHPDLADTLRQFPAAFLRPMSAYFAVIGLSTGLLGGFFRVKAVLQNRELSRQAALLEELGGERECLVRMLTHDLTNNVVASRCVLRLAARRGGDVSVNDLLDMLQEADHPLAQAEELMRLVRTVVALESGKIDLPLSPSDVGELLRDAVVLFGPRCAEKDVRIRLDLPEQSVMVDIEPTAFQNTVVNNLLSNAIKFSLPAGEVVMRVVVGADVHIGVTNHGPCINSEKLACLFSASMRTSTAGTAGEKGTGFGLPLAERFVRKMHGTLSLCSKPLADAAGHCATTVTITLPLSREKAAI